MSSKLLTSDNPLLSRLTNGADSAVFEGAASDTRSEINFTGDLPCSVAAYVENSLSENSRRAYAADLLHFEAWGGSVPAADVTVAGYLAGHVDVLSVATLARRLATISKVHTAKGFSSPTCSELVKATMRGIKRSRGIAQAQAKPLLRDDLFLVLERTGSDIKSVRDRALLLIGFAGGFRRSEMVGLDVDDVEHVRQGLVINLRRSKTDQIGAGRKIAIPLGRTRWCPVRALDDWLSRSAIETGPLFRPVNRHGYVLARRLSGEAVSLIIKERVVAANIEKSGYSGHSLRAGFATSAAMAGASTWKIRAQTGHASDTMLARYVRDGDMFTDNAAAAIL